MFIYTFYLDLKHQDFTTQFLLVTSQLVLKLSAKYAES